MNADIKSDDLSVDAFDKYKQGNWDVHVFKSCSSTFDIARQKIKDGAKVGTLIISDVQTGGKGRQAKKWYSPSAGIWVSVILKPKLDISILSSVTLLCAVAVSETIEQMYENISPTIKWPNDIYINNKKVCGILTETILGNGKIENVIAGIGINANNSTDDFDDDVRQMSISFAELGLHVNRAQMASLINDKLQELIKKFEKHKTLDFILKYYTDHMHWMNKQAVMINTITGHVEHRGIVRGIDNSGHLLLEIDNKVEKIVSGELSLRKT